MDFQLAEKGETIENNDGIKIEFLRGTQSKSERLTFQDSVLPDDKKPQNPPVFKKVVMINHRLDEFSVNSKIAKLSPHALGLPKADWVQFRFDNPGPYDDEEYPKQWNEYLAKKTYMNDGTPLRTWHYLLDKIDILATLQESGINTIEQLGSMPEQLKRVVPNCDDLIKRASKYLQIVNDENLVKKLTDAQEKDKKIANLEAMIADLKRQSATKENKQVA